MTRTPRDTDGDSIPDYLDDDSDENGITDVDERGKATSPPTLTATASPTCSTRTTTTTASATPSRLEKTRAIRSSASKVVTRITAPCWSCTPIALSGLSLRATSSWRFPNGSMPTAPVR